MKNTETKPDKVLIVDDRPENLYSLESMLAEDGKIVRFAKKTGEVI